MTTSPKPCSAGTTAPTESTTGDAVGRTTKPTTSRFKKPPVMITCADCGAEILKKDACALSLNRKTIRVCQNCIRMALGLPTRKP